jgi:hypothetical protein
MTVSPHRTLHLEAVMRIGSGNSKTALMFSCFSEGPIAFSRAKGRPMFERVAGEHSGASQTGHIATRSHRYPIDVFPAQQVPDLRHWITPESSLDGHTNSDTPLLFG